MIENQVHPQNCCSTGTCIIHAGLLMQFELKNEHKFNGRL
jgi:hypothetical protein